MSIKKIVVSILLVSMIIFTCSACTSKNSNGETPSQNQEEQGPTFQPIQNGGNFEKND